MMIFHFIIRDILLDYRLEILPYWVQFEEY